MVTSKVRFQKLLPWLLIIGGVVGLIASLILTYDQIQIWRNPGYQPACSLNPIVSCGTVINSKEGEIFGIPAPFFGLVAMPALITVGVTLLAGATFKRWFWQLMELGLVGSLVFALWLFWLSLYRVHALCPFCLAVDVVIYALFWYGTLYVLQAGYIRLPQRLQTASNFATKHHLDILLIWFLLVVGFILQHFWYYFGPHWFGWL